MTIQEFFYTYPLSLRIVSDKSGINYGTLRHYTAGLMVMPDYKKKMLQEAIREIGQELTKIEIK